MGENGHLLKECSKTAFAKLFNAENYQERFPYIKDYVYVDKSTEMGKYYMKAMYVNLCIAIRPLAILSLDMDYQEECKKNNIQFDGSEVNEGHLKAERFEFRKVYDAAPAHSDFDQVDIDDFAKRPRRRRGEYAPPKKDLSVLSDTYFYRPGGGPPKKGMDAAKAPCLSETKSLEIDWETASSAWDSEDESVIDSDLETSPSCKRQRLSDSIQDW
jgi:hypothetical protein